MSIIKQVIIDEMEITKKEVIARMDSLGRTASGQTAKSFEIVATDKSVNFLGSAFTGYGVLEKGRSQGKVPQEFIDLIKKWMIAKKLNFKDAKDLNRWAGAIAWKIRKEGTIIHRNGIVQDIFETPFNNLAERLDKKLSPLFVVEYENMIMP